MPPLRFRPPLPVQFKTQQKAPPPALAKPDIVIGTSVVANTPGLVVGRALTHARTQFRLKMGRTRELHMHVHPTVSLAQGPQNVTRGQGRGPTCGRGAKVAEGKVLLSFQRPPAFPGIQRASRRWAAVTTCLFRNGATVREQNNQFVCTPRPDVRLDKGVSEQYVYRKEWRFNK